MKKQNKIITAVLLGSALAACITNKAAAADAPAPPAQVESQMRATYGFAAQLPASTASYTGVYQLGKMWSDFMASKTWASIQANPLVSKQLSDPSFQQAMQDPDFVKWKAILMDALGSDAFIAFSGGSEAKVHAWMKVSQDMRAANFKNALASYKGGGGGGEDSSRALYSAILPDVKDLDIPPVIIGFKVASQKAALDSELAIGEKDLPPFVETGAFNLNGIPFKSISVTVSKAMPPEEQDSLKQFITTNTDDAAKADETFKTLLSRKVEIAYGYVGDYFIISIGPDHSHLKFAANYGESLLARPEVQQAAGYTGKQVVSLSWSSAEMAASLQQEFRLMEIYGKMQKELRQMINPADTQKLETDLKRLDAEGKDVFTRQFTSMIGVVYRDNGLRGEVYGGVKRSVPAPAMKFSGVPDDSTFLWVDQIANQPLNDAMRMWVEDFAATAYDTFQRVGLPMMPADQQQQAAMMQQLVVPKVTQLYQISRDELAKSLGSESVFAMDLNGEIPNMEMAVPAPIQMGGRIMRLTYLSDLRDRALLEKSWESYFKLASDILPMTPVAGAFPGGLPEPSNKVVDGVSLSFYPLPPPLPVSDLLPNVAVTDTTFVVGTSRSYSVELSKAAAKSGQATKPLTFEVRLNFKPAFDFAGIWLKIAAQNPGLFFRNEEEADEFSKSEPDIAALLDSLRALEGFSVQGYEENGVPRISSQIRWDDK